MTGTLTFAEMQPGHVPQALGLSRAVGWPHRAEDWQRILGQSRGLVALEGGRMVGTALCTLYPGRARLNMVIVDARMRGRGLGRRLVSGVLDFAEGRPVSLIATADGFPLYEKLGFVAAGEVAQVQGTVARVPPAPEWVQRGGPADLDRICAMEAAAGAPDRSGLLLGLLSEGALFLSDAGFAIVAPGGRGGTVGPIVARDAGAAGDLLAAALQGRGGAFLRIDTDPRLGLLPALLEAGLGQVGGGTVMHRGAAPEAGRDFTCFSLISQALG